MNLAQANHAALYGEAAEPITLLINGNGLGVSLLIALIAYAAFLISREVRQ